MIVKSALENLILIHWHPEYCELVNSLSTELPRQIRLLLHCSRQWLNVRTVILFSNQESSETLLYTARNSKESENIIFSDGRR